MAKHVDTNKEASKSIYGQLREAQTVIDVIHTGWDAITSKEPIPFMNKDELKAIVTPAPNYMGSEFQAFVLKGFRELANTFGQAFPQQISMEQPGELFSVTQMQVNEQRGIGQDPADVPKPENIMPDMKGMVHSVPITPSKHNDIHPMLARKQAEINVHSIGMNKEMEM